MGREIRRVPSWWKHPDDKCLHDQSYENALAEWTEEKRRFDAIGPSIEPVLGGVKRDLDPGQRYVEFEGKTYITFDDKESNFEEWHGGAPDLDYYRPAWNEEEATCYQLYENVSEGSPLSPVFATLKEVEDWMVANGDPVFGPISRKAAQNFCEVGSAASMEISPEKGIRGGVQAMED